MDINVNQGLEDARKEEERKARMVKPKMPGDEYEYQVSACASQSNCLMKDVLGG